jgi:hypothetical protein
VDKCEAPIVYVVDDDADVRDRLMAVARLCGIARIGSLGLASSDFDGVMLFRDLMPTAPRSHDEQRAHGYRWKVRDDLRRSSWCRMVSAMQRSPGGCLD